ncbi:MAG TPA: FkbM family methyltransferase [Acidimicrobiales bacterium]|nr:FkbM family methyltransferase [Acidimicrobiales bacterium]
MLSTSDWGARQLLLYGKYINELDETQVVSSLLPDARGIPDIGASYGWYTRLAANITPVNGMKIALEANPAVADCLSRSLEGLPGVDVRNTAATDAAGLIAFHCALDSALSSAAVPQRGAPVMVRGLPVDHIWPKGQPLDFVKCDVEGGELRVLRGARGVREAEHPIWMMEFDDGVLAESETDPSATAEEVSDLSCWWRGKDGEWSRAGNLAEVIGRPRHSNVFLVPSRRLERFATCIPL